MKYLSLVCLIIFFSFSFSNCCVVKDTEGHKYRAKKIGNQVWMDENLRSKKFNDGTVIPHITDNTQWSTLTSPGYCWYDHKEDNDYGILYHYQTITTDKNVCPNNWRVPTKLDYETLVNHLGGYQASGVKLMEKGTEHWNKAIGTNESGFTALGNGARGQSGVFINQKKMLNGGG